ncbi:MAG TPA: hypothetical protein VHK45_05200 [Geminicoccaceae bacterium]|jgi:hypothetical protein|nr:hypothetical protein [Geminicoccaceae bacterium]
MSVVAIDRTKGSRKVFTCPYELAAELDAWRAAQRPIPSESQAIVQLLRQALKAWREQEPGRRRPNP